MRFNATDSAPFDTVSRVRAAKGWQGIESVLLPFSMAFAERLPSGLSGMLATSGLQGSAPANDGGSLVALSFQSVGQCSRGTVLSVYGVTPGPRMRVKPPLLRTLNCLS